MKFSHRTLIAISGFVWLAIGIFLFSLGLHFILDSLKPGFVASGFSIMKSMHSLGDKQTIACFLVTFCLLLGYMKGKFALRKSVHRQIKRIQGLPNPGPLRRLYGPGYYILIAAMIGLGISLRFLPISLDTRGGVDLAIGAGLINGALLYFRYATTSYRTAQSKDLDV